MASAFVRNKHSVYGLTHFLCIPITTPQSRPQLQKTLHQFSKDPCTSRIPSGAYRPLQTLHIPIRTLSLQTQDRIEAACHHLRSLDIDGLLRRTSETTPGTSLTITLSGVYSKPLLAQEGLYPDRGSLDWRLKTSCADSTSRLRPFLDEIRRCFDVSGFQIPGARPRNPDYLVILLSTMHAWSRSRKLVRDSEEPYKLRAADPPLFETKDITKKFENFVFAESLRLERLSLCELGLTKRIQKMGAEAQLLEVCSVPLP